eukprot:Selendium_serpulae@DN10546_c0_g1_i1.p1
MHTIPNAMDRPDNTTTHDPMEISTILKNHCTTVFGPPTTFQPQQNGKTALPPLVATEQMVSNHISKLKPTTALGQDSIPMTLLKKLVAVVSRPLAILFHRSLKKGVLPQQWRDAIITLWFGKVSR